MQDLTPESARPAPPVLLRPATPADVPAIVGLVRELADFEHLSHLVELTPEALHTHLFGARPVAEALVAQVTPVAQGSATGGEHAPVVAFALWFTNFSTFLGKPGLWLEDLYVQPAWRGRGIGRAVLAHLAALAVERGCGRFEWSVLDWNASAIRVYEGMGATVMPEWRICRLAGEPLAACAASGTAAAA